MAKNLWDIERKTLFISVLRDYQDEGYDKEEAKKLAKKDVDDIMNENLQVNDDLLAIPARLLPPTSSLYQALASHQLRPSILACGLQIMLYDWI